MKHIKEYLNFLLEGDWKEELNKLKRFHIDPSILKRAYDTKSRYGTFEVEKKFNMEEILWGIIKEENRNINVTKVKVATKNKILYIEIYLNDSTTPNFSSIFDTETNVNQKLYSFKEIKLLSNIIDKNDNKNYKYKTKYIYFYHRLPEFIQNNIDKETSSILFNSVIKFIMDFYAWWEEAPLPNYQRYGGELITKKQSHGKPIPLDDFSNYYTRR